MSLSTEGVIEVIHGVEVHDQYRWLEDRSVPKASEWIDRQYEFCEEYFSCNSFYAPIRRMVSKALFVNEIDQAVKVADKVFLKKQLKEQEHATISVRQDGAKADRLLVDPTTLGPTASVDILRISPDGMFLAYSVRYSGSDAMEVRIVDVATGFTRPDCLPSSYLRGFDFDVQRRGFYYCIELPGVKADFSINFHRFGDSLKNDVSLFTIPYAERRRLVLLSGIGTLAAVVTNFSGSAMVQDLYVAADGDDTIWNLVLSGIQGRKWPLVMHGRLFLFDMESTPNGSLVELCGENNIPRCVVAERTNTIHKCFAVHEGFLVSYLIDRQSCVEQWSLEGKFVRTLALPAGGSIGFLSPCRTEPTSLFFLHESYTTAPSLWECKFPAGESEPEFIRWTEEDSHVPGAVRESWYMSSDGTRIPITLLEPYEKHAGPQPVVLFGYGGFGASELPRYSRLAKILVELGVTIARPAIRGGAEFGERWHRAATGKNRQRAIDDFLSAAEWLLSEGITDQEHLAIMGGSNGGLLVAASVIQRPDLFKAAVCTGPLIDMVRYERFDGAARWRREYGTIENLEDFRALLAYSPLHNVKESIDYPAMLFVTGDADDRCNPAHARKMVAALQGRDAQQHSILLDHSARWGHAPTMSLAERIEALTRKIAFLCDHLDLRLCEGAVDELPGA